MATASTAFPDDASIAALCDRFITCAATKAEWTHEAHWAAALWLLRRADIDAFAAMPGMIRRFNESLGGVNSDTEGYHQTITLASLCAARAALEAAPPDAPVHVLLARLMAGEAGRSDWPLSYWRRETLFSGEARREWVEPDLAPLPWA